MFPISKTWVSQAMNEGSHTGTLAIDFGVLNPYNVTALTAPFNGTVVHVDPQNKGGGIAFQSDEKVLYVNGTCDYMTLWTGHDNNPPKVGAKFKQGEVYSHMGTAGGVAKHCHLEVQRGKFIMPTKYVKTPYGNVYKLDNALEPFKALFLHEGDLIKYSPYSWEVAPMTVGTPVERNEYVNQIEVISTILNARKTPSLKGERLGYITPGIYNIIGTAEADGYVWYEVEKDMWIAYNKDWETLLPKKDTEVEVLKKLLEEEKKKNENLNKEILNLQDKMRQINVLSS
jgi:hypothetical protein